MQHGFVTGRSMNTNLIMFVKNTVELVDSPVQVEAIYTNLSKAFYEVDLKILARKLLDIGIDENLIEWFVN